MKSKHSKTSRWIYEPRILCLTLLVSCYASNADAHGGRGVNGGPLFDTGTYHVEFVGASGYEILMIALSDKFQKPVSVNGVKSFLAVERGGQKIQIPLRSMGDGILSSSANPQLVAGETVWFVAQMPNGSVLNAQFTSK
jgi:hypothetical protein